FSCPASEVCKSLAASSHANFAIKRTLGPILAECPPPRHAAAIICPHFHRFWRDMLENARGVSRVEPTIKIRRQPSQYCRAEWGHRQSSSAPVQRWWGRNARYQGQSHERGEKALA